MLHTIKSGKIRLILKSGNSIDLDVEDISIEYSGSEITNLTWKRSIPDIIFVSLPYIEAIFELT